MNHLASRSMVFALFFAGPELMDGKKIEFPKKDSKATVVLFLSAKCPCSASHEKPLKELASRYSKEGFEFIGVHSNQNESTELAQSHFKSAALGFPVIEDRGAKIADQLKALKTPHAFILKDGKIVFEGGVDDSSDAAEAETHYLADALQALQKNEPVPLAKARALGCQIKR